MDRLQQTSHKDTLGRVAASTGMVQARCSQVGSSRDPGCAVVSRTWQVWGLVLFCLELFCLLKLPNPITVETKEHEKTRGSWGGGGLFAKEP